MLRKPCPCNKLSLQLILILCCAFDIMTQWRLMSVKWSSWLRSSQLSISCNLSAMYFWFAENNPLQNVNFADRLLPAPREVTFHVSLSCDYMHVSLYPSSTVWCANIIFFPTVPSCKLHLPLTQNRHVIVKDKKKSLNITSSYIDWKKYGQWSMKSQMRKSLRNKVQTLKLVFILTFLTQLKYHLPCSLLVH